MKNNKDSISKKIGDKIERVGEKISNVGNKLEHSKENKRNKVKK